MEDYNKAVQFLYAELGPPDRASNKSVVWLQEAVGLNSSGELWISGYGIMVDTYEEFLNAWENPPLWA